METTYTVKSKQDGFIWSFKYTLNGDLRVFIIDEGTLSAKQMKWLFGSGNFPANESIMRSVWMKQLKANFEITIGEPDLSFEAFWTAYNHKIKKVVSEKAWERLGKKDRMAALAGIKPYDGYLSRKGIAKAHPATYLNQRYWEDNHASIH
jgi:hypothetical protein